jgi:hypothetical protein
MGFKLSMRVGFPSNNRMIGILGSGSSGFSLARVIPPPSIGFSFCTTTAKGNKARKSEMQGVKNTR